MFCTWCRLEKPWSEMGWWEGFNHGDWYCCRECSHNAGYHSLHCPCTTYVKRRRYLREHREQMRVMQGIINENGLGGQCAERMVDDTGNTAFLLSHIAAWDDGSDVEDPDDPCVFAANVAAEAADREALIDAVGGMTEHHALRQEIARLRVQLEDAQPSGARSGLRPEDAAPWAKGRPPCRP